MNQKKLDTETKILQNNAAQFAKQTTQWLKLIEDFNTSLKVKVGVNIQAHCHARSCFLITTPLSLPMSSLMPCSYLAIICRR